MRIAVDGAVSRWILNRVAVEPPGLPRELVDACLLLASDAASFPTGRADPQDALACCRRPRPVVEGLTTACRRRGKCRRALVSPRSVDL